MRHLTINVPTRDINLYPISDVQVGAAGANEDGFREHIEYALDDPYARFIGVGDYTDGVSPSNRRALLAAFERGELYDTAREMLVDAAKRQAARFLTLVEGTEGRWDGLLGGHHFFRYTENGQVRSTDMDIAEAVGAPYLATPDGGMESAIITYRFPSAIAGGERPFVRVYVVHGQGGGQTFAGPLNQLERMARGVTADVYIVAHHHKLVAAGGAKLDENPDAPTSLAATDFRLVGAGSWLRGYMPNESTYAEDGLMSPLAIGAPIVHIHRRRDNTFRIRAEV